MAPSVFLTASDVPSLPWAEVPTPPLKVLPAPLVQAPPDAACRYCWKLSLVPDASLRETTWMSSAGMFPFSAVMAGSSQRVMAPLKILASVGASKLRTSVVLTLKVIAIGPKTAGRFHASVPPQRCLAPAYSPPLSGESEPPKSVLAARKSVTPAPDPLAV